MLDEERIEENKLIILNPANTLYLFLQYDTWLVSLPQPFLLSPIAKQFKCPVVYISFVTEAVSMVHKHRFHTLFLAVFTNYRDSACFYISKNYSFKYTDISQIGRAHV